MPAVPVRRFVRVCLGGTFHPFHVGHEALLRRAMRGASEVFVGVTHGELAKRKDRTMPSWEERAAILRDFFEAEGFAGRLEVAPIEDSGGRAPTGDYDAIVVSPETAGRATRINEERAEAGLDPLVVHVVPHVMATDLLPVSSTRVASGDIARDGRRLRPVRVAVGSDNPVKTAAVESEVARILGVPVEVRGEGVDSGVPEQPRSDDTLRGARNRAEAAMEAWPDADYAVGVEAGLNQDPGGHAWYDAQACAVLDRGGRVTDGWGPAFQYPDWVTQRALAGEMVSRILGPVADDPRIGGTTGAIGFLTDGLLDRTGLTRQAVLMAFVPRIRADLYARVPDDGAAKR